MNFLLALILVFSFIVYFQNSIKTSSVFYYIIACLISGTEIVAKLFNLPDVVGDLFYPMFANGIISMALLTFVMFVGAVEENTKFHKIVSPLRAELSIIACILALGHNFSVGITSLDALDSWSAFTDRFSGLIIAISFSGIALMLFLLAISFKTVRLKFPKRDWKNLQRLSYVLYVIIFTQILLVSMPLAFENHRHYIINSIVYTITFLSYVTLRCLKAFKKSNKTSFVYIMGCAYLLVGIIMIASKSHASTGDGLVSSSSNTNPQIGEIVTQVEQQDETPNYNILNDEIIEYEIVDGVLVNTEIVTGNSGLGVGPSMSFDEDEDEDETIEEIVEQIVVGDFTKYQDGTYTGSGMGKYDLITVSITIENRQLTNLAIVKHNDTLKKVETTVSLLDEIVQKQTINVDVVSGATFSSNGIMDAVREALSTAPLL